MATQLAPVLPPQNGSFVQSCGLDNRYDLHGSSYGMLNVSICVTHPSCQLGIEIASGKVESPGLEVACSVLDISATLKPPISRIL